MVTSYRFWGGPFALHGLVHFPNTTGPSLTEVVYAYFDRISYIVTDSPGKVRTLAPSDAHQHQPPGSTGSWWNQSVSPRIPWLKKMKKR